MRRPGLSPERRGEPRRALFLRKAVLHLRKRLLAAMLVPLLVLGAEPVARAQETAPGEYELKAAFLFNFVKFVNWPDGTFANTQSSFIICVLGKDPFGHVLDEALQDKKIDNRNVVLQRVKDSSEARHCHAVFVSASESAHLSEILEGLRGAKVLLVGDMAGFAASGGMIEFILEENHVRFAINVDAADRAGLKISAKLLALAKIVHDASHSKGM